MGAILLAHTAIEGMPVTDQAMIETHGAGEASRPYVLARLNPCSRPRDGFDEGFDWEELAEWQSALFERDVRPTLDAHPSWPVVYFGMVPIPLAIHLGSLIGQMARVESRLFHHVNRNWLWPRARSSRWFAKRPRAVPPTPTFRGPVVTRVSTSYEIEPEQTEAVVPKARSFDVRSRVIHPDSIRSAADLEGIVRAYKQTIDDLANAFPNAEMRHLFASVPVGLAFRLGAELNPNLHVPLQTWKHMSRRRPEYRRAILVSPRVERPRVLVVGASPPDTTRTTAQDEVAEIEAILQGCGDGVEITTKPDLTLEEFPDLLRQLDPMFVHFAGHGRRGMHRSADPSTRDLHPPGPSNSVLVVHHDEEDPYAWPVELADLTRWIGERRRRVVVLTACHSEPLAEAAARTGSVCIGFRGTLKDGQARAFARVFWKSMRGPGRTVDHAFRDGLASLTPEAKEQACLFPCGGGADFYLIPRGGNHG